MVSLCMLNQLSPLRAIVDFYVPGKWALSAPDAMAQKIYAEGTLYAAGKQAKAKEDAAMIAPRRAQLALLSVLPQNILKAPSHNPGDLMPPPVYAALPNPSSAPPFTTQINVSSTPGRTRLCAGLFRLGNSSKTGQSPYTNTRNSLISSRNSLCTATRSMFSSSGLESKRKQSEELEKNKLKEVQRLEKAEPQQPSSHSEDAPLPESSTAPSYLPPMTPSVSEPRHQTSHESAGDGIPQRAELCASQDDGIRWMSTRRAHIQPPASLAAL
ncbi:hypothetical protein BGY98DRAFT_1175749 [Russula aff. rugulosa BPL654]|nr:hypothetical protein BGY98DRAFT_1175749 [Russula aff. rugulosa BPL654]